MHKIFGVRMRVVAMVMGMPILHLKWLHLFGFLARYEKIRQVQNNNIIGTINQTPLPFASFTNDLLLGYPSFFSLQNKDMYPKQMVMFFVIHKYNLVSSQNTKKEQHELES
jgi:hypothetical protein